MDFNIAFLGPEYLYHLRRDLILPIKYGLEDLGHRVSIGGGRLDSQRLNLVIGAHFQSTPKILSLANSGLRLAYINTEIIANDMLNYNPDKVDFLGAYLPTIQAGQFIWEVTIDNMAEHERYGNNAHYLRWGWHPKIEELPQEADKDIDFYFFGMLSARRREILDTLTKHGFRGRADHSCPYFQRNDFISRSKIQLNIIQEDVYSHVNSFRICYLANNRCAIVSEQENDPAGYLDAVKMTTKSEISDVMDEIINGGKWKSLGEAIYEDLRSKPSMKTNLEMLLDKSLASPSLDLSNLELTRYVPHRNEGSHGPSDNPADYHANSTSNHSQQRAVSIKQPGLLRRVLKEVFRGRPPNHDLDKR